MRRKSLTTFGALLCDFVAALTPFETTLESTSQM
jgi:hypothetical protein